MPSAGDSARGTTSCTRWRSTVAGDATASASCGPILEECYGADIPDSHFNRLVERLLVAHGLRPTVEHVVRDASGARIGRLDLAFVPQLVGVELDSRRHHLSSAAFEHDRQRQNRLELQGWLVLRYTWRQYTTSGMRMVGEIARAVSQRSS